MISLIICSVFFLRDKELLFDIIGGETSVSDLKGASEALMSGDEINEFHIARIREKNYAFIGKKQFTFFNSKGIAELFQKVNDGVVPRERVLLGLAEAIESVEDSYFDHLAFSERVRSHVSENAR